MADFLKSKAKHWRSSTVKSKGVFRQNNYKTSHNIGSRKASERCISYSDTFPVYKSLLAFFQDQDMKSPSVGKSVSKESHEQNDSKSLPAKKKIQAKDFINNSNICCFVKLSRSKNDSTISTSKPKLKDLSCKVDCLPDSIKSTFPKLLNKTEKYKKQVSEEKDLVNNKHNSPGNSNGVSTKSKNKIKSIERKMCVKRKLEVLSCKLEENNNVITNTKSKTAPKIMRSKNVKNNKGKSKIDNAIIPRKRKKREASLNASALVNIYFEKEPTSPKKLKLSPSDSRNGSESKTVNKADEDKVDNDKNIATEKSNKKQSKKVNTAKEKSNNKTLKEINVKKKSTTKEKINGLKTKQTTLKENILSVPKNDTKKTKTSKCFEFKKVKEKLNGIRKPKNRMASLNAQALMAATKYLKPNTERAARTDRFCLSWVRQPFSANHYQSTARWVEGWGNTCCTVAAPVNPETTLHVSRQEQQLYEDRKTSTVSMQITPHLSHNLSSVPHYEAPALSQMEQTQVIHRETLQKITHLDQEIPSDDRPSSVVDVVGAHTPMKPVARTSLCMNPLFRQNSACVPPCTGYCCTSTDRYISGQYQSITLGGIGSLNTVQMMTYPQPPYRSAFSVPYAHTGLQSFGFYPRSFYQANPSSLMQPPIHNMNPCLLPHHVPVQVPHAQIKVLIHNPDKSHDCAFSDTLKTEVKGIVSNSLCNGKGKKGSSEGKCKGTLKQKKKTERKTVKTKVMVDRPHKDIVLQQSESSCHGWSWKGEAEWKLVQNIVDGPPVRRKCYSAICHTDGDVIHIRDCVLLRSGPRKTDIPFVAKVGAFWEHPDDGEMMMSLLWYYRPEHTEMGRQPHNQDQEIFASKHRDENSVACIEDKAYVLTSGEYARYKAEMCRVKQGACYRKKVVPDMDSRSALCDRLISSDVDPSNVFLCHQVYDFRQKRILKNPS